MRRRDALKLLAGLPGLVAACARGDTMSSERPHHAPPAATRLPVIYLGHGAPPLLDDPTWPGELAAWARAMPKPRAILMVSAHWEARPVTLGATRTVPLVYDFYGFPQKYYELTYASPGAPELATRVRALLADARIDVAPPTERGLDHGAFVPLLCMYPHADVPVLQMSMPTLDAAKLVALGRALAPLRDEGALIVGSGFMTHNLRTFGVSPTPQWAHEFDQWATETLARKDVDTLVQWERAPGARQAHPREEHLVPLFVSVGASEARDAVTFPIAGFWMDMSFSKRSVQLG